MVGREDGGNRDRLTSEIEADIKRTEVLISDIQKLLGDLMPVEEENSQISGEYAVEKEAEIDVIQEEKTKEEGKREVDDDVIEQEGTIHNYDASSYRKEQKKTSPTEVTDKALQNEEKSLLEDEERVILQTSSIPSSSYSEERETFKEALGTYSCPNCGSILSCIRYTPGDWMLRCDMCRDTWKEQEEGTSEDLSDKFQYSVNLNQKEENFDARTETEEEERTETEEEEREKEYLYSLLRIFID